MNIPLLLNRSLGVILLMAWLVAISGESASALFEQGIDHFQNGRWQEAAAAFERALILRPGETKIQHMLGRTLIEKSVPAQPERLTRTFETLAEADHTAGSLYWLGVAYLKTGDQQLAEARLSEALKKQPVQFVSAEQIQAALNKALPTTPNKNGDDPHAEALANFLRLCAILAVSLLFVAGLKRWVFKMSSVTRDFLLFLLTVVVLTLSALSVGFVDLETFTQILEKVLDSVPAT